jgi:8-amino-7-oxononanoate synthase
MAAAPPARPAPPQPLPGASPVWSPWLEEQLGDLRRRALFRTLRPTLPGASSVHVRIAQAGLDAWLADAPPPPPGAPAAAAGPLRQLTLFSLNDYLGLATHPAVRGAWAAAGAAYGAGPRSSALVGGHTAVHAELAAALADLKGAEAALLAPTGYAANLATLGTAAAGANTAIFSDALNHASIVDGARLAARAGATVHVYRHNDLAHLEELLAASPARRQVVVTDALFSMDGDYADLAGLAALRARRGFLLAVDEAHSTLVAGPRGGGAAEAAGVADAVDLHIGTLSKAIGSMGGFVACSRGWAALLANRGRAQVFSTALPVPAAAAASAALAAAAAEPWRRARVAALAERLAAAVGAPAAASPIVPVHVGGDAAAVSAQAALLRRGFHAPAIRPPTVAPGTARLRLSLSAAHSDAEVEALGAAVREVLGTSARGPASRL